MKKKKSVPVVPKGEGNNSPSPSAWFTFTFNNYSPETIEMFQGIEGLYVFQEEICPTTGTPHLQGTIRFTIKKRLKQLHKDYPGAHWECCRKPKKSVAYCHKKATRAPDGAMYTNMKLPKDLITLDTLRPWQEAVYKLAMAESDDRTINWYWEEKGNVGKSSFARWMVIKHNAFYICGSASDMKCGLASISEKNFGWFPEVVILDIPRGSQGCSYKGLEQLKNGIFYSTKYESGMVVFNPPHIIVFANEEPDKHRMSEDRWNIIKIGAVPYGTCTVMPKRRPSIAGSDTSSNE